MKNLIVILVAAGALALPPTSYCGQRGGGSGGGGFRGGNGAPSGRSFMSRSASAPRSAPAQVRTSGSPAGQRMQLSQPRQQAVRATPPSNGGRTVSRGSYARNSAPYSGGNRAVATGRAANSDRTTSSTSSRGSYQGNSSYSSNGGYYNNGNYHGGNSYYGGNYKYNCGYNGNYNYNCGYKYKYKTYIYSGYPYCGYGYGSYPYYGYGYYGYPYSGFSGYFGYAWPGYAVSAAVTYSDPPAPTYNYPEPQPAPGVSYSQPQNSSPQVGTNGPYKDGHDWGQDLRRNVVSWDGFVGYLRENVTKLSDSQKDEFRKGFVLGYDNRGQEAFQKAMQEASASATVSPKPTF